MTGSVLRIAGSLLALPAGALVTAVHRWLNGAQAVLELEVVHQDDLLVRQALIHRLRRAAEDPTVAALLLRIESPPGGWAACQDLHKAIGVLRGAGKSVYAMLESPGNAEMYLASACDQVFLPPMSEVGLVGMGIELQFFGRVLERLGVQPDFEAAGAYKSFGETYTRSFASPANQEALRALVDDLHAQLVSGIAEGRALSEQAVVALLAQAPLSAEDAVAAGLVDQCLYGDQLDTWLKGAHGDKAKRVRFGVWAGRDKLIELTERMGDGGSVVVVLHLEGPIVMDNPGPRPMVRAKKLLPVLKRLRSQDRVSAVVLHVNSPGGSALASDLIWREVAELQRVKPVVAVFEDVAASGGYYLSAPCAEILARPGSLTGSIGVFGGKLVVGGGLRKLGVSTQQILAAPNAAVFSASRPFTDGQRVRFKASLQRFYDGFVQRVAAGRRRPEHAVEPHCRGRVWTGRDAKERGLIDRYGDLYDAVERARKLAGLHRMDFVRRDLSTVPSRSMLSKAIANALKGIVPASGRAGVWLSRLEGVLGMDASVEVILDHPSQPLAMLPFRLWLGGRR